MSYATHTQRPLWLAMVLTLSALTLGLSACQGLICLADPEEEHLCEPSPNLVGRGFELIGPVKTSAGVAYRVPAADRITLLRTNGGNATVQHIPTPDNPSLMRVTPDGNTLLVLSPTAQRLVAINVQDSSRQVFDLGSPFTSLELSPDGRFAIAFAAGAGDGSAIVQNNNEMAVIDLSVEPGELNPQLLALRSLGSRPYAIEFAPPFTVQGQERRMALILSDNYVTLLELDGFDPENPNANEILIPFVQEGDARQLRTERVLWTDDDPGEDDDFFAFLLVAGSDDIISLNLLPGEAFDELNNRPRIKPSLNQLTGGRTPVSMDLFETSDGRKKLLSLNRTSRDLAVIDVATSDTTIIPLEAPVEQALVFQAINRDNDRQEPFALLYSANQALRTVLFVELETVEVRRTRAISPLNLDRNIASLTMTPDPTRALVVHEGLGAVSILNLERRFVTPLDLTSTVSDFDFDGDERLLTILNGLPFVAFIDLSNGHPTSVELDMAARSMAVIPETNTIVVDHGEELGGVTLLPLAEPTRENARILWGFGVDNLFDLKD